jgi:pyruvate formate lyase activating enzyme
MLRKAALWHEEGKRIRCDLCSHRCAIADTVCGICGVRQNQGGTLYSLNYGKLVAAGNDPIEKKPFFHFQPGSKSFSIATAGCNFKCLHCQNYQISQLPRLGSVNHGKDKIVGRELPGQYTEPEAIVRRALEEGCKSIAYTYTEPTIFFEYARDCAELAARSGLKNIFVTNGYMTQECVQAMENDSGGLWLDAANVDIKSFSDDFYRKVCSARLAPVLECVERLLARGVWVEVTTLIIPGYNDSEKELRELAKWISKTNPAMPWHISAFYPTYKLINASPTPAATIERARVIGLEEGLRYVYSGNLPGDLGESTYCYECGELLIDRIGFEIRKNLIKDSECPYCKIHIDGVEL